MNWKEFLSPTRRKIVWFISLIIIFTFIQFIVLNLTDIPQILGSPLTFYSWGCYYIPAHLPQKCVNEFFAGNFIFDVLFWLLVAWIIGYFKYK